MTEHEYGPHSNGVTYPPSLDPHRCLIRDFLNGPIDREKTESLLHLALAAERARCVKIARGEKACWPCDCGEDHTETIATRIEAGDA